MRSEHSFPFKWLWVVVLTAAVPGLLVAAEEQVYGAGVGKQQVVGIGDILEDPQRYVDRKVVVEGRITDVCPRAGCWINIEDGKSAQVLRFKVTDGEIVFPMETKGKGVIAEGVLTRRDLDVEQARAWFGHLAEEKGETFDPESITGPMTIYQIQGSGAIVR